MKRILLGTLLLAATFSQHANAQKTTFGIKAGVNFYNITGKDASGNSLGNNKLSTGFNAGVNAEVPLSADFYFQPGLLFTVKGTKSTYSSEVIGNQQATLHLNYLELPLNLVYKAGLGNSNVLLGAGPYVGYGLSGKWKGSGFEQSVKFKNTPGDVNAVYYRPWDAGINLLAGFEFSKKFSAQLDAQLGLANINAYSNNAKQHNTGFGISVGYRF